MHPETPLSEAEYVLGGHTGALVAPLFHPDHINVIATAGADTAILLGELAQ